MRIGINGMLLWGQFSGVEVAIDRLIAALARVDSQHEYVLYVSRDFAGTAPRKPNWSVRRANVPAHNRLARIAWEQGQLPKLARRDKLDVLHGPGYVLPLWYRAPTVLSVYDLFALTHPDFSRAANVLHYRFALPRSVRHAGLVIVPSAFVADELQRRLGTPARKIRLVPLGVDSTFAPVDDPDALRALRARYRLPETFVLFVGNLEPKKNLPRLLRAFALARKHLPSHVALVLAGKPAWEQENLPRLAAELQIAHRVQFLNRVPQRDLASLYSLADTFAFPSLSEGFGMPALEAMACGTPVVASGAAALREVAGGAAYVVDPESVESLAEGITTVITDADLRDDLRARGFARARQFTWERTAEETLRVYEELVEDAHDRGCRRQPVTPRADARSCGAENES